MTSPVKAGFAYAATVFAVGFALGTLRVLLIAPRLGEVAAVWIELPIILTASLLLARRIIRRFAIAPRLSPRAVMGAVAFAMLMVFEFALGSLLFGRSLSEQFAGFATLPRQIGLIGQVLFALIPAALLLDNRGR